MKKMLSYDDYMLEMIAEALSKDELKLVISDSLRNVLQSIIKHPISNRIIGSADGDKEYKVTYLDLDDSDPKKKDMVSFMNSNKVLDDSIKKSGWDKTDMDDDEWRIVHRQSYRNQSDFFTALNRSKTKIGRVVGKLYPGEYKQSGDPGNDIESFVNMFKAARDTSMFEIVNGKDIKYWYNENQYTSGGGQLNNSCMKYDKCADYLELYSDNEDKVSLVILKDPQDDKKIRGRAILWQLDSPSGRTFMDRIYTAKDSDVILFQEFAKENGWLHKKYQNMDEGGPWVDTKLDKDVSMDLVVNGLNDPGSGGYPYMDTMKFFDSDSISNDEDNVSGDVKKLEDTSGGYEEAGEYSDFYDENINPDDDNMIYCDRYDGDSGYRYEDDCFYSDYYNESICNQYAEDNMEELDHYDDWGDKYRDYGDYVTTHEGNTCSEEYATDHFAWSEYHDEWLEDSVYSEYHQDHIAEDEATEVYTDVEGVDTDWRIDDGDGHWWKWDHDGEKYDDDITEEELIEHHDLGDDDEEDEDEDED